METHSTIEQKIVKLQDLKKRVFRWKFLGKKIVFTNGVFDIVHPGHVDYLHKASLEGDILIVGLNSDASVKTLGKAENRPINTEWARAFVLAGLHSVGSVVVFDNSNPFDLIKDIMPDVLVKGGDYDGRETNKISKTYIVGSDIVKQSGGTVKVIPFLDGFSTTSIITKIVG
jgi:rfaE bifunctional protein nucleotidyltransferase chain/domain